MNEPILRSIRGGAHAHVRHDSAVGHLTGRALYIDDLPANVEAAGALGMHGVLFTDPAALRSELVKLGLLDPVGQIDHVAAHRRQSS